MNEIQHLPLLIITAISISLIPGPSTLYIVSRSVSQGRGAGLMSVLGIGTGSLCHAIAVAFGLSALLMASQSLFLAVKLAGALYLIYLGVKLLVSKSDTRSDGDLSDSEDKLDLRRVYTQGVMTQILNPKATLFFAALLPQFVNSSAGHSPIPFLILGALFVTMDTIWFTAVALSSAKMTALLRRSERIQLALKRATGLLYIGLGLSLLKARAMTTS